MYVDFPLVAQMIENIIKLSLSYTFYIAIFLQNRSTNRNQTLFELSFKGDVVCFNRKNTPLTNGTKRSKGCFLLNALNLEFLLRVRFGVFLRFTASV